MCELVVNGGRTLEGRVRIQGSKNAVLPILAATLLTQEPCVIEDCPHIADVEVAFAILRNLGCEVQYIDHTAYIDPSGAGGFTIPEYLMRQMRSSVMFLGAILSRNRKAYVSYPGGCALGARPIDMHLGALCRLGVHLEEAGGYIDCRLKCMCPQNITLLFPSVGATENIMLLCAASQGETTIVNAAREPEIVDLQNFLNAMGACIRGAGSDMIRISGVEKLHGCQYRVIPDRIVASTYACAAAAAGGDVLLTNVEPGHMRLVLSVLRDMGCQIDIEGDQMRIRMGERPRHVPNLKTLPYPGFPTDAQPLLMAALTLADGTSVMGETIFESRFKQVGELVRMGADISVEGVNAIVRGVNHLHGAVVQATDLRGGAALAIAALAAEGESRIREIGHIDRGYESIETALASMGANIWRE